MSLDPRLRYPKEQPLFIIGVLFSSLVWLVLVASLVGIFYGLIGLVFTLIAHALFLAHVRGNGVRVSERQFPELHERCRKAAETLGLAEMPEVYLIQSDGALNAFATKLLSRKFIIILSDLADHCQDPRQLDFVIGHEMGHLAAGHLTWNAFLWPFFLVPWLGAAYMRAREYTCDRCGIAVVGDLEASMRGLVVLAAGGRHAAQADLDAFMEQRLETGRFFSSVLELVSTHPYLCKRVAALKEFREPGTVRSVSRNPLAYPLAPVFSLGVAGAGGGSLMGLLVMVAMIGIIAAIAIPSLLRARIAANEATALGDVRTFVSAELTYAQLSGGVFAEPECLVKPATCLESYDGKPLLHEEPTAGPRGGYERTFTLAEDGSAFTFVAVPVKPGQTGVRGFCGDSQGMLCATRDGSDPALEGRCDPDRCEAF